MAHPATRRRSESSQSTPKSGSDAGSSESTAVATSAGPTSDSQSVPSPPVSTATMAFGVTEDAPSLGSVLHNSGHCRPCGWFWKPQGCKNGRACGHCHLCHAGEVKARKKSKMVAAKREISLITSQALAAGSIPSRSRVSETFLGCLAAKPHARLAVGCQLDALVSQMLAPVQPSAPLQLSSLLESVAPQAPSMPPSSFSTSKVSIHGAPPSPPSAPPRLTLPLESIDVPPPVSSPSLELSPGALPRSLAMACMDDDTEAEDEAVVAAVNPEEHVFYAVETCQPRLSRVTLELSTALLPSVGSALHGCGGCTACAWFWKPQGCANGEDCPYCHLCPQGEIRRRRKMKNTALRAKAALGAKQALEASGIVSA